MALDFKSNNVTNNIKILEFVAKNVSNDVTTLKFGNTIVWKKPYVLTVTSKNANCNCKVYRVSGSEPSATYGSNSNILNSTFTGGAESKNVDIYHDDSISITITPNTGSSIESITIDGVKATLSNGSLTGKSVSISTDCNVVISTSINSYIVTCKHVDENSTSTTIGPNTTKVLDYGTTVSGATFANSITNTNKYAYKSSSANTTVPANDNLVVYRYYYIKSYTVTCYHRIVGSTSNIGSSTKSYKYDSIADGDDFDNYNSNTYVDAGTGTSITVTNTTKTVYKYYYYKNCTINITHKPATEALVNSSSTFSTSVTISYKNTYDLANAVDKSSSFGTGWYVYSTSIVSPDFKSSSVSATKYYSNLYKVTCYHRIVGTTANLSSATTRWTYNTSVSGSNFTQLDTSIYVLNENTSTTVTNNSAVVYKYYYYKNCKVTVTHTPASECSGYFTAASTTHDVTFGNSLAQSTYNYSSTLGTGWYIYSGGGSYTPTFKSTTGSKTVYYSNKYVVTCKHYLTDTTTSIGDDTSQRISYGTNVSGASFSNSITNTNAYKYSSSSAVTTVTGATTVYRYYSLIGYTATCKHYVSGTTTTVGPDTTTTYNYGTVINGSSFANSITNTAKYEFNSSSTASVTVTENTSKNIVYRYYKVRSYTITCKHYASGTTTQIGSDTTTVREYDTKVSGGTFAVNIGNSMKYQHYSDSGEVIVTGATTVYKYYTVISYNVNRVCRIYNSTVDIGSSEAVSVAYDSTYSPSSWTSPGISGYQFYSNGNSVTVTPTSTSDTYTVYKYYRICVTMYKYWMSYSNGGVMNPKQHGHDANAVISSSTSYVSYNASYSMSASTISNYEMWSGNSEGNATSINITSPISVYTYYRKKISQPSFYESYSYSSTTRVYTYSNSISGGSTYFTIQHPWYSIAYTNLINNYCYASFNSADVSINSASYYAYSVTVYLNKACNGYNTYHGEVWDTTLNSSSGGYS